LHVLVLRIFYTQCFLNWNNFVDVFLREYVKIQKNTHTFLPDLSSLLVTVVMQFPPDFAFTDYISWLVSALLLVRYCCAAVISCKLNIVQIPCTQFLNGVFYPVIYLPGVGGQFLPRMYVCRFTLSCSPTMQYFNSRSFICRVRVLVNDFKIYGKRKYFHLACFNALFPVFFYVCAQLYMHVRATTCISFFA
jgi:hypothetical protein